MQCWRARRKIVSIDDDRRAGRRDPRLDRHLAACAACAGDLEAQRRVSETVAAAGRRDAPAAPAGFETRVLAAVRSRSAASRQPPAVLLRPLPVAASVAVMIAAGAIAILLGGGVPGGVGQAPSTQSQRADADVAAAAWDQGDDRADRLLPPREIPFTIHEDLVGPRRGLIPETTYILEPPPDEAAVVRASL